jgi:hypothetical protein
MVFGADFKSGEINRRSHGFALLRSVRQLLSDNKTLGRLQRVVAA